jgi:hypothetical protein
MPPRDVVVVLLDSLDRHLPSWAGGSFEGEVLYDRAECDAEGRLIDHLADGRGGAEATEMADLLVEALREIEAPAEQLVRLGLE